MIERLRQMPVRMETWGAKPAKPLSVCRHQVEQSDALIVIVGHRYGWIPGPADGMDGVRSITWLEVQWALDAAKPVYAFLVDRDAPWSGAREQDRLVEAVDDQGAIEVGRAVRQLAEFRTFLEKSTTYELFTSAEDLAAKVASSLHTWLLDQMLAAIKVPSPSTLEPPTRRVAGTSVRSSLGEAENSVYWQEQVHLGSAQITTANAKGQKIVLLASRPNMGHPALAGTAIGLRDSGGQANAPEGRGERYIDDFTTHSSALLLRMVATTAEGAGSRHELVVYNVFGDFADDGGQDVVDETLYLRALVGAMREGANVLCVPFGSVSSTQTEKTLVERVVREGVVVVAAGDEVPSYPAALECCIGVAAVNRRNRLDRVNESAAFVDWVTTAAPGELIDGPVGHSEYSDLSGPAIASVIAAGAAALVLSVNPALTPPMVKEIFREAGTIGVSHQSGATCGRLRVLDIYDAVQRAKKTLLPSSDSAA